MHNIIHFYYQNKEKIWKVILISALIIGIIKFLNYMSGNNEISNGQSTNSSLNANQIENSNTIVSSENSLVQGGKISATTLNTAKETIDTFINYCNSGNAQQAYDLLTDECKEELYPSLEIFKENYWSGLFNHQKIGIIENWTNDTYKITMTEDMLTTGNSMDESKYIEYMTIVDDNDIKKLNINNYIGREKINKVTKKNNLEITAIYKNIYMDYETYTLQINNKSDKDILLDNLNKTDTIYLQDTKAIKYNAHSYKLLQNDLTINKGLKRNIEITFSNGYTTNRKLEYLVFSEMILDYKNNMDINQQETYAFYIDL